MIDQMIPLGGQGVFLLFLQQLQTASPDVVPCARPEPPELGVLCAEIQQNLMQGQCSARGSVCPVCAQRAIFAPSTPTLAPVLPSNKGPPSRPESTPNPSLYSTQHQTYLYIPTHVTCIVPKNQFCPNKGVVQYTQNNNFHYIHHNLWCASGSKPHPLHHLVWQLSCLQYTRGKHVPMVHTGGDKPASNYKIVQNVAQYSTFGMPH